MVPYPGYVQGLTRLPFLAFVTFSSFVFNLSTTYYKSCYQALSSCFCHFGSGYSKYFSSSSSTGLRISVDFGNSFYSGHAH